MHAPRVMPADLGMTKLLAVFAALSVALLAALAIAPARSRFTEWRAVQERYDAAAVAAGLSGGGTDIRLRQIWRPELQVADRCTSCHLGMGAEDPIPGDPLFGEHPDVHHDPAEFGCTLCHGGQGRATTAAAAHGDVPHWDEPLLERERFAAGCGSCHTHLRAPAAQLVARGELLFRRHDCWACHRVDGAGGRFPGPDLSLIGYTGFEAGWHAHHLRRHELASSGPWATSYGDVPRDETAALDEFLLSRFGGSRLVLGKTLAHRLGCRGCHRVNGVGGDDGPDLTNAGRRIASELSFAGVRGERTVASWLRDHFQDPIRVSPGSGMPDLGIDDEEADLLTLYVMSLRPADVPARFWPPDRMRAVHLGEREFGTDGESLFGVFCAACHGERGEGRSFASLDISFPAVANPSFLAIAPDSFLRRTLEDGRPGRRMPAWGTKDGGLRSFEVDAIISWLRTFGREDPARRAEWAMARGDAGRGRVLFEDNCAACHGERGEGSNGPSLASPAFQAAAGDDFIAATIALGRDDTEMPGFATGSVGFEQLDREQIADLLAFVRTLGGADEASAGSGEAP